MCSLIFVAARSNRETVAKKHTHGRVDYNIYFLKMELGVLKAVAFLGFWRPRTIEITLCQAFPRTKQATGLAALL